MTDQRIKGQEVSVRIIQDGVVVQEIDSIANLNESTALELKEAGYLGETTNRFDEILNGFGGDMEINLTRANWIQLELAVIRRARRETPGTVFNVVVTDLFPNGESLVKVYQNVFWGEMPKSVPGRGDYVKPKLQFKCSERAASPNALP